MGVREKLVEQLRWWAAECDRTNFGCQARKLLVEAADYIAHGVTVQEWISVKDRLPEEGDRCLCRLKSFASPGSFYQSILRYDKYGFQDGGVYEEGVTHWMPLPQPPKGE